MKRGLLFLAILLAGCGEDFATGPETFPSDLDVANWADTLVVGDHRAVTARVLDGQGREVLGRTIQWTIATPGVVDASVSGAAARAAVQSTGAAVLSVAGGSPVELQALQPGTSTVSFGFQDELFHETSAQRSLTVVTAGIQLASASDTSLTTLGDTAVMVASALGHDQDGGHEARAGLGVEWTRTGPGAVELLGSGDTVRAVAKQDGTDTLVVAHAFCQAGATCSDTVLVRVVTGSEPPPPPPLTVTISPATAEIAVSQPQQFTVSGAAGPYVWSVDGVDGGAAAKGLVDPNGAYVAPAAVPAGGTVQVCVRLSAQPTVSDCATVTIAAAPPAGADVVVVNDVDSWSADYGMGAGNQAFFANIVNFTATGPRADGQTIMYYTGSDARCGAECNTTGYYTGGLSSRLTSLGYTLLDETASLGTIPSDVKVIFLWLPTTSFSASDVNKLKQFASEGGRLVVVGENGGYYAAGIDVENQLLADLGSQLVNQGDCALGPGIPESSHQLMAGVSEVELPCASTMTPGPSDWVVARDQDSNSVVIAVTRIDLTPLPE